MMNNRRGVRYSQEFKADAVALVRQGVTQTQVCRDLGISKSALTGWLHKADAARHGFKPPKDLEEDKALRSALRQIKILEQENEILRQAAAYLGQAGLPKN